MEVHADMMSAVVQGTASISDGSAVGFSIRLSGCGMAGTCFALPSLGASLPVYCVRFRQYRSPAKMSVFAQESASMRARAWKVEKAVRRLKTEMPFSDSHENFSKRSFGSGQQQPEQSRSVHSSFSVFLFYFSYFHFVEQGS